MNKLVIIAGLLLCGLQLGEASGIPKLIERAEGFNWSLPTAQEGKYFFDDHSSFIAIKIKKGTLRVENSDGDLLFSRERFIVGGVRKSKNIIVCDLFLDRGRGFNFYGFLICAETHAGVLSRLSYTSPNFATRRSGNFKFYFLDILEELDYPRQTVVVVVSKDGAEEDEVWKAQVLLGPELKKGE